MTANLELRTQWRGFQVFDVENGSDETRRNVVGDLRRSGGRHGMAIDQRSQKSSVNKTWHGHVLGSGNESRDDLRAFDETLQLVSGTVAATTPIAMGKVVRIQILNG